MLCIRDLALIGGRAASDPVLSVTSGLIARWESDSITGLVDGGIVTNWPDTSGSGRDATQTTATPDLRPTWHTNVFGTKPSVRCDGSNDQLNFTIEAAANFTVFVGGKMTVIGAWSFFGIKWRAGASGAGFALDGDTSSSSNPVKHLVVWNSSGTEIINKKGPDESLSLPTPRQALDVWRYDGTTVTMRKNGSAQTVGNGTSGYSQINPANIGNPYNPCGGDFAAILVYNTALSDGDVALVEAYINAKYGLY